ncbi:helix-turn-helix domain-containing protein [Marinactinospora rubrisoli]|uniref:Helix-turn-helix domain-containing protein n=1 Tax=Marinactinospora rubrisoli TaxID=2715399 RepID=A0ABW2KPL5_9ACTN
MPNEDPATTGQRIARARKLRGVTQLGLAARCRYSRSQIAKVESGARIATPGFVAQVAAALGVTTAELYGQPYAGQEAVHAHVTAIREVLAYVDVPPELDAAPRPLEELARESAVVARHLQQAQHTKAGALLPALLEELAVHVAEAGEPRAWQVLHRAQVLTLRLTRKLGHADLADYIAERARVSAAAAADPHLEAMLTQRRTLMMMDRAQWRPALASLEHALRRVDEHRPDAAEVLGAIRLRQAVIAARAGRATDAWDHFAQAQEIDVRAGERAAAGQRVLRDAHGTTFTSGNIGVHGAAVAVELRDYDEVVKREPAPQLLADLIPERRAHHSIDMARALVEARLPADALRHITTAESLAPEMVRYHPTARTVVEHLVDMHNALPAPLRRLQRRMRVI